MFDVDEDTAIKLSDLMQAIKEEVELEILERCQITNSGHAIVFEAEGYGRMDVPWADVHRLNSIFGPDAAMEYLHHAFAAPFLGGVVWH